MPAGDAIVLLGADGLGVLSSTAEVVHAATLVQLDPQAVRRIANDLAAGPLEVPAWNDTYHWSDGGARTVNTTLLLDALNFCFWADHGAERWSLTYRGEQLDGYWALAAALKRAIEDDRLPLWDASFLVGLTPETAQRIFHPPGGSRGQIPLFEHRVTNMREVGAVLLGHFNGWFAAAIERAGHDAVALARLVARTFPSFNDTASFGGTRVRFYKRAQILVGDLHGIFGGRDWGALGGLERLTAFADYKIPQLLREEGVLRYSSDLATIVDAREPLPAGSIPEVEIRAATIWGVELLRRELLARGVAVRAFEVDWLLWARAQDRVGMRPYHRVRTIYY